MIRRAGLRKIIAISIILLLCVALYNYIILKLERKFAFFVDFSSERMYSVSDETRELCRELSEEVIIYYYDSPGNSYAKAGYGAGEMGTKALLESYNAKCDNISVITLSGESAENFTSKFGEKLEGGSIIVTNRNASRYRVISSNELYADKAYSAEQSITGAIRYVETGFTTEVRFLTGHREKDALNLNRLSSLIASKNIKYTSYDALTEEELIPGKDVLFVVSPDTDLEEEEYKRIRSFLNDKGNAVFFIDKDGLPYFSKLMREYDLALMPGFLTGTDAKYTNMDKHSVIVKPVNNPDTEVVLTNAKPIAIRDRNENAESLLMTYPGTAENSINPEESEIDAESFPVCVKSQKNGGKLILFGTSSIVTDEEIDVSGNSSFIESILTDFSNERFEASHKNSHSKPAQIRNERIRELSYTAQVFIGFFTVFVVPLASVIFCLILRRK